MEISFDAMQRFLRARAADLRRIVRGAKGDVEIGDVESEAYVVVHEIQSGRGRPFNFDDAEDQDRLMARLWNRIVKFQERYFRTAVKIDDDPEDDGASLGAKVARSLLAAETYDPAVLFEQEEGALEMAEKAAQSYSEAVAYVILLRRFDDDRMKLALYLCIALATLATRLRRAAETVAVQPSIFDGIERVPEDFDPTVDRARTKAQRVELAGEQWAWSF